MYKKPTCTDATMGKTSFHPESQKLAPFGALYERIKQISLVDDKKNEEVGVIRQKCELEHEIVVNNGYKKEEILSMEKKIMRKTQEKPGNNVEAQSTEEVSKIEGRISYISEKIKRILQKFKVKVAVRTNNKKMYMFNGKDKIDLKDKSGVYRVHYKGYPASYVGEAERSIRTRIKEHSNTTKYSVMLQHLIAQNHNLDVDKIRFLHQENKGKRLQSNFKY
ncbi:hypothetical protein Zmor_001551 [Zophobas morio]|uniref:GIY-YIG domain-containing protein n=1 Tax=Zophobas morio TaxID=2755281 RepID=A0AA38MS01_9CUCU|nr:hypothetical protein Zmor_001551 [Zophobas morio]